MLISHTKNISIKCLLEGTSLFKFILILFIQTVILLKSQYNILIEIGYLFYNFFVNFYIHCLQLKIIVKGT